MKKKQIKKILCTLVGIAGLPAIAHANTIEPQIVTMDELPSATRTQVFNELVQYFSHNPEAALSASGRLAIDQKGTVYVLDKNTMEVADGQPSCYHGGTGGRS